MTFAQMSLSFIFLPEMFFQDCHATVMPVSHDIGTSVPKILHCKFAKFLRRQVCDIARTSHDSRVTVLRIILAKNFALNF